MNNPSLPAGTLVTRDGYAAMRDARQLRIGGDLWTNDAALLAQVFSRPEVVNCRMPRLTTGLWADVEVGLRSGHITTIRVYG